MAKWVLIMSAAVLVMTAGIGAQPKPNFSGRWVLATPVKGSTKEPQEQIVRQDEKTLTTEHVAAGPSHKMIYQLDGVERRQAIPSHNSDITMLTRAFWEGDHIVIAVRTSYSNGMKTQSTETWSIDKQGRLVIDFKETANGAPGESRTILYTKKKDR